MAEAQLIAVIRIRGSMETRFEIEETLCNHLRLTRKLHATVFTTNVMPWLQKCKDYITWGPIDRNILAEMVEKRGEVNSKRVDKASVAKIVDDVLAGKVKLLFRLHPPVGGFKKSTKLPFPKGELGKRDADSMKKLLARML